MRLVLAHTLVMLFVVTGAGAAQPNRVDSKPAARLARSHRPGESSRKPYQVGRASWYGKYFHGRKTASGEPYNMFQFTAAHQKLPLGTLVKVTNLRNSRWVVVRINDRGPVPKARIIDLSYGAAQILDLRQEGVERVRLDVVDSEALALARQGAAGEI